MIITIIDIIMNLYRIAGSMICHQLPSRTLYVNELPLPLCARDTGIYIGAFISVSYIYLSKRKKADSPPGIKTTLVLCFLMLLMIIDGCTSYLGIRETNNILRYYSGTFFGLSLPFFLIPAAYYNPAIKNTKKSMYSIYEILILIVINFVVGYLLFEIKILPWILPSTVTIISLIYVIARIVFTVVVRAAAARKPFTQILVAGGTVGVLFILFCISNFLLQPIKALLLNGVWR